MGVQGGVSSGGGCLAERRPRWTSSRLSRPRSAAPLRGHCSCKVPQTPRRSGRSGDPEFALERAGGGASGRCGGLLGVSPAVVAAERRCARSWCVELQRLNDGVLVRQRSAVAGADRVLRRGREHARRQRRAEPRRGRALALRRRRVHRGAARRPYARPRVLSQHRAGGRQCRRRPAVDSNVENGSTDCNKDLDPCAMQGQWDQSESPMKRRATR